MFTGIVRTVGRVEAREPTRLWVAVCGFAPQPGASVAINGVCLTVSQVGSAALGFDLAPETVARTTLHTLRSGAAVNVEPALALGDELGGHWVLGHVDGVGKLTLLQRTTHGWVVEVAYPQHFAPLMADKGCVAVDGISLTPFAVREGCFRCAVVPHTWGHTNLRQRRVGDPVNLEFDVLAKYVIGWRER